MAGDNVGSWFAVGTIGSIITGGAVAVVPFLPDAENYALQLSGVLVMLSVLFALVALIAFAGFLNLVVRYLREISERPGHWN
jgi:VIT1/CCC1 family predicted Fe2+/Mn2+ transporter